MVTNRSHFSAAYSVSDVKKFAVILEMKGFSDNREILPVGVTQTQRLKSTPIISWLVSFLVTHGEIGALVSTKSNRPACSIMRKIWIAHWNCN